MAWNPYSVRERSDLNKDSKVPRGMVTADARGLLSPAGEFKTRGEQFELRDQSFRIYMRCNIFMLRLYIKGSTVMQR